MTWTALDRGGRASWTARLRHGELGEAPRSGTEGCLRRTGSRTGPRAPEIPRGPEDIINVIITTRIEVGSSCDTKRVFLRCECHLLPTSPAAKVPGLN
ncbi:hypothetical protein Zmor_027626 [Zophobas morio]|uniref:Uncharacterized protein n=1 Tax=Zophobas morio TaxID=2755281 RepID=A0AA38M3I0_9CUCU|nr:hypothetical protein Zmor_027626 [Zophobas morio]